MARAQREQEPFEAYYAIIWLLVCFYYYFQTFFPTHFQWNLKHFNTQNFSHMNYYKCFM